MAPRTTTAAKKPTTATPASAFADVAAATNTFNASLKDLKTSASAATADRAVASLAYLRAHEKGLPAQQLENASLALIGRLLGCGMDAVALRELRILKRRIDAQLGGVEGSRSLSPEKKSRAMREPKGLSERSTFADLLRFEGEVQRNDILPVVVAYQLYVLRYLTISGKPALVESVVALLDLEFVNSPSRLVQQQSKLPGMKEKSARQLESLAQTLLILCPSTLSSEDTAAMDRTISLKPDVAFRLQCLALRIRTLWWGLAGHQPDLDRELWMPLSRYQSVLIRRVPRPNTALYELAKETFAALRDIAKTQHGTNSTDRSSQSAIVQTLSMMAQAAGLVDESLRWTSQAKDDCATLKQSHAKLGILSMRSAFLSLERPSSKTITLLQEALACLKGSLKGDSSEVDRLLVEVSNLRKGVVKALLQDSGKQHATTDRDEIVRLCEEIPFAAIHFLLRYMGGTPANELEGRSASRYEERKELASKVLKGFLDALFVSCRNKLKSPTMDIDSLHTTLQESEALLNQLSPDDDASSDSMDAFHERLGNPATKISSIYFAMHNRQSRTSDKRPSSVNLVLLQRSVNLLKTQSMDERIKGNYLLKLTKLAECHLSRREYTEAGATLQDVVLAYIDTGIVEEIVAIASSRPLTQCVSQEVAIGLNKTIQNLVNTSFQIDKEEAWDLSFCIEVLDDECHAILLELRLVAAVAKLSTLKQSSSVVSSAINGDLRALMQTYDVSTYPIRRLRVAQIAASLSSSTLITIEDEILQAISTNNLSSRLALTKDKDLQQYMAHHRASVKLSLTMNASAIDLDSLQETLATWQSIAESCCTHTALLERVDDLDALLQQLETVIDFLGVRGHRQLRAPALGLMTRLLELQSPQDPCRLSETYSKLGLQLLQLGCSGKAGIALAKGENWAKHREVPATKRVAWNLAYAQYLLAIGASERAQAVLVNAAEIATQHEVAHTRPPNPSASMALSKLFSDAWILHSKFALNGGDVGTALDYARRSIKLNQKIWMELENQPLDGHNGDLPTAATAADATFKESQSATSDKAAQLLTVTSMTHGVLAGPVFWPFVPSFYETLVHCSRIYAHAGEISDAVHYGEQAKRVAAAVQCSSMLVEVNSLVAEHLLAAGRIDKAQEWLDEAAQEAEKMGPSIESVLYQRAVAAMWRARGEYDDEIESYDAAIAAVIQLKTASVSADRLASADAILVQQVESLSLGSPKPQRSAPSVAKGTRKTAARRAGPTVVTESQNQKPPTTKEECTAECVPLKDLQAQLLQRKCGAMLLNNELAEAARLISEAEQFLSGKQGSIRHKLMCSRQDLAKAMKELATDFTFSVLPESTISLPAAVGAGRMIQSEVNPSKGKATKTTDVKRAVAKAPAAKRKAPVKKSSSSFVVTLQAAKESLQAIYQPASSMMPTAFVRQISSLLNSVSILLSAASQFTLDLQLHPLHTALCQERLYARTIQQEQALVQAGTSHVSRAEIFAWPETRSESVETTSAEDFQRQYIDIIPPMWTAVALSIDESKSDLIITRYRALQSPFILRLPLTRHSSRDMDEDTFDFEAGKVEMAELIDLANFSAHDAKDMHDKEQKSQWWAAREALDARLKDLLVNIENIWLGGFRGVLAQGTPEPTQLSRFQKSLQSILGRHLPSRQGRGSDRPVGLDPRILELFTGLGDPNDESLCLDLDEPLSDLLYFVVDILQFNGERNAYDEIDFDAMVIECIDALKVYHSSATLSASLDNHHTVLILDRALHSFPWECLPSVKGSSISRLPSLIALRSRIEASLASRRSTSYPSITSDGSIAPGYYLPKTTGHTILNPSGDLVNTQHTIQPCLSSLPQHWTHTTLPPTESSLSRTLSTTPLFLYFGHGSGNQYIRARTIKRSPTPVATTWLMGCSSSSITENGDFEPSGTVLAYLSAGSPAVLGTLWDVTDRDCDRASVEIGRCWGLWDVPRATEEKLKKGRGGKKGGDVVVGGRGLKTKAGRKGEESAKMAGGKLNLCQAVVKGRGSCYLEYLNGAAFVVYGIPVWLL